MEELLHAWTAAEEEHRHEALKRIANTAITQPSTVRAATDAVKQSLITCMLQASLSNAPVPTAVAAQATRYKLLLDRLWQSLLVALPLEASSFALFETIIAAHTPATNTGSQSRRSSLKPDGAAAVAAAAAVATASAASQTSHSRRGSLAPVEEQTIASIRQHAFKFAFEFVQMRAKEATAAAPFPAELSRPARSLFVRGMTDMWSAIRKTSSSALARSAFVAQLIDAELQELFDTLMQLALGEASSNNSSGPSKQSLSKPVQWQVQEGAVLGISSLLACIHQRQTAAPSHPLPAFLSTGPSRFYPLLAHAQLTVREYTCAVLREFVELQPAAQSTVLRHELIATLMHKLDAKQWLSDYENEGILNVFHALGLPFNAAFVSVLDRYLSHPASSVRQLVAEVLAKLALADSAATGDSVSSSSQAATSNFVLPAFLASDWQWEHSEAEAALAARSSPLLGDMHTAAVFFVIPPPLYDAASTIASALSRRSSLNVASAPSTPSHARAGITSFPSSPSHAAAAPAASAASSSASALLPANYRSSWQWKEGALMCLELWLRAVAPTMDTQPRVQSAAAALGQLFPQVVRAAASWSWELRRMAEQVRTPFLAVWLRFDHSAQGHGQAGREIIRWCQQWMNEPAAAGAASAAAVLSSASSSPSLRPAAHPPVSLSAAVSTALCLHLVLSHLHRVQCQSSTGCAKQPAQDDQTTERKWNQDVDELRIHPAVRQALSKHLPALLTRLEQLVVSTQLAVEHSALSTPSLSSSPTMDNLAMAISAAATPAGTAAPLISSEQFTTLALQVLVAAYSLKGEDGAFLHVSEQSKLQHYQCVLDRLRVIRSLCLGDEIAPSLSVAAQMPLSPPLSPARAPQLPSAHMQLLPTFAPLHSPAIPLVPSLTHKLVVLRRARAKRLESWLIGHLASQLPAFTGAVPSAAHIDLLDLLHDYLLRYHKSATIDVRQSLLKSISVGWLRIGEVHQPLWSHQLHQLQESSLALLLQLLPEAIADRSLIVAALTVLVTSTPIHRMQLQELLTTIAKLVADEYEDVSLLAPPPDPATLLSPTSAAAAAEVEAWDDWDEDESDGAAAGGVDAAAGASAFDNFVHARQLVVEVSPLLSLLESLSFSATPVTAAPIPAPKQAHAQSSLAQLVAAYESESTAAKPDTARQLQLLQWIQQWASQAHTQVATTESSSASSSSAPASAAARLSSHHPMPINSLLQDTRKGLSSALQAKLRWMQEQAKLLNYTPPPSAQELLRGNSDGAAAAVGLHFSKATEADLPALVDFAISSNDSHHTRTAPRSTAAAIFAFDPVQARSGLVEVARDAQGAIVGFSALKADETKPSSAPSMDLSHLFVSPAHHKRGIGRCLFHRALTLARSFGCAELHWVSDPDATGFYEKMGAQKTGQDTNQLDPAVPVVLFKMALKTETAQAPGSSLSALPGLSATAALAASATVAASAPSATRIVCLRGMVSPADLATDAAYRDLLDDVTSECARFGTLRQVLIPRPAEAQVSSMPLGATVAGVGRVFLEYASTEESQRAFAALQGRFFAGVQIAAGFWDEAKFARGELNDEDAKQADADLSAAAAAGTKRARD